MQYATVSQVQARVQTNLGTDDLADMIAEASAMITLALGVEPGSPIIERFHNPGPLLWLTYSPSGGEVTEVRDVHNYAEDDADGIIDADTYLVIGTQVIKKLRGSGYANNSLAILYDDIDNLGERPPFPEQVKVTYAMTDSPGVLAICRGVCIDLVRLFVDNMGGLQTETLGSSSRSSKDHEKEVKKTLRRLNRIKGIRPVMAG